MTSSLTHVLFASELLNSQVFRDFLIVFLLLNASLISLWLDDTICIISVFENMLVFVLWHWIVCLGECCVATVVEWRVFQFEPSGCVILISSILNNFLKNTSIICSEAIFKSPIRIVYLFISLSSFISFCFMYVFWFYYFLVCEPL